MASRFVSAGGDEVKPPEGLSQASDDAWSKARKQVEESKKSKDEGPALGTQEGGKSLYEHLQAQKAAKQEAFEEATKLRNQFRPLDDGEVDFLEGIKRNERLQAETQRQETASQLDVFRKEQAAAEQAARDELHENEKSSAGATESEEWTAAKKRRRVMATDKADRVKSRKLASADENDDSTISKPLTTAPKGAQSQQKSESVSDKPAVNTPATSAVTKPASSLVAYGSDSDD